MDEEEKGFEDQEQEGKKRESVRKRVKSLEVFPEFLYVCLSVHAS